MRFGVISEAVGAVMAIVPTRPRAPIRHRSSSSSSPTRATRRSSTRSLSARSSPTASPSTGCWPRKAASTTCKAGTHMLTRTMSPREVAANSAGCASDRRRRASRSRCAQGLRLEQIVAYLQTLPLENLDTEELYGLATAPSASCATVQVAARHSRGSQRRGLPRLRNLRRAGQTSMPQACSRPCSSALRTARRWLCWRTPRSAA